MAAAGIYIASNHAGFPLKQTLAAQLREEFPELSVEDLGPFDDSSVDYPEYARRVAERVAAGGRGILVCGSGIGMAIAANKSRGVRAASVWDVTSARLSREHNDTNVVCFGARLTGVEVARAALRVWLNTPFAGGRHQKRVDLISKLEGGV